MAKITSKMQVTVPKAVAEELGWQPGDEIEWLVTGESARVVASGALPSAVDIETRLRLFDAATERQRRREGRRRPPVSAPGRGWTREDLYPRARPR